VNTLPERGFVMEVRIGLAALLVAIGVGTCGANDSAEAQRRTSIHELSLEVAALQSLYDFRFTADQLKVLAKLAPETREDDRPRTRARVSREFEKALQELREALTDPEDDDRIGDALAEYAKIQEKEDPDLDDSVEITETAKDKAPEILRSLSARQLASFLVGYGDQFPDPVEDMKATLARVRELPEDQWKVLRRVIGQSIGDQVAGLDGEKGAQVGDEAIQILIQARSLDAKAFERERPALEKKIQDLVKNVGPLEVIRNTTEIALATLLSNPRLEAALKARTKE
jgi:hypothetical protein